MKVEIYYETYPFVYFSVGKFISTKDPTGKPYGGEASSYYRLGEKYRLDITNNSSEHVCLDLQQLPLVCIYYC
jgi:hypothetical protein